MVVDAAVEHEAVSGMVVVAITGLRDELDSLLGRVQGMEACNHVSRIKTDRRLQELEAGHSKKSNGAGTATGQHSEKQNSVDKKGGIDREEAGCRDAITEVAALRGRVLVRLLRTPVRQHRAPRLDDLGGTTNVTLLGF